MAILLDKNGKVDGTNPDNFNDYAMEEAKSRKKILSYARMVGSEKEILLTFAKYDKLLRNCKNEAERKDMGKLAAVEILKILGPGEYTIDNQIVKIT